VTASSWDAYISFRHRALLRLAGLGQLAVVDEPGMVGAYSPDGGAHGGLLVLGRVPGARLAEVLRGGRPQWVAVLPPAQPHLPEVVEHGWDVVEVRHAMALPDLDLIRPAPMPPEVSVQPVAVRHGGAGYPLEPALRLAVDYGEKTQPAATRDLELEAQMLRRLSGIQFFAATTSDGSCVGTAGSRVVDSSALVASVATYPTARRRGIGTAMTAVALRAAATAGAVDAYLDATDAGCGIYRRLGFLDVGPVIYCERSRST
jgi:GNAT superfamily N-acetyltransferase